MDQNQTHPLKPRAVRADEDRLRPHHHSSAELWDVSSSDEDSDDEADNVPLNALSPPYSGGCLESFIVKSVYWILRVRDSFLFEDSKED